MKDLKKFIVLRKKLEAERTTLEERLSELNEALGAMGGTSNGAIKRRGRPPKAYSQKGSKRVKNPMPLRAAVIKLTTEKALTKGDILKSLGKVGYTFNTSDPMNSLNAILYGTPKFKRKDDKFSPP